MKIKVKILRTKQEDLSVDSVKNKEIYVSNNVRNSRFISELIESLKDSVKDHELVEFKPIHKAINSFFKNHKKRFVNAKDLFRDQNVAELINQINQNSFSMKPQKLSFSDSGQKRVRAISGGCNRIFRRKEIIGRYVTLELLENIIKMYLTRRKLTLTIQEEGGK